MLLFLVLCIGIAGGERLLWTPVDLKNLNEAERTRYDAIKAEKTTKTLELVAFDAKLLDGDPVVFVLAGKKIEMKGYSVKVRNDPLFKEKITTVIWKARDDQTAFFSIGGGHVFGSIDYGDERWGIIAFGRYTAVVQHDPSKFGPD